MRRREVLKRRRELHDTSFFTKKGEGENKARG